MGDELVTRLVMCGLVTPELLTSVRDSGATPANRSPRSDGATLAQLVDAGLDDDSLAQFFAADGFGPVAGADELAGALPELLAAFPGTLATEVLAMPVRVGPIGVVVAMAAPSDAAAIDRIRRAVGRDVVPVAARVRELLAAIESAARYFSAEELRASVSESLLPSARERAPGDTRTLPPAAVATGTSGWSADSWAGPGEASALELKGQNGWTPLFGFGALRPGLPAVRRPARPPPLGRLVHLVSGARTLRELAERACAAGATVSRATMMLVLRDRVLHGEAGTGGSFSDEAVRGLWIPVSGASMFRDVVQGQRRYVGGYGGSIADGLFRAVIGGRGGRVVVTPVSVRGKVVAVLAADEVGYDDVGVLRLDRIAEVCGDALARIREDGTDG